MCFGNLPREVSDVMIGGTSIICSGLVFLKYLSEITESFQVNICGFNVTDAKPGFH